MDYMLQLENKLAEARAEIARLTAATEPVAWMQRHKLGPHHLCNPDTQAYDDWSDPFPVYTHTSPVTVEAAVEALEALPVIKTGSWCKGYISLKSATAAIRALAGEKS